MNKRILILTPLVLFTIAKSMEQKPQGCPIANAIGARIDKQRLEDMQCARKESESYFAPEKKFPRARTPEDVIDAPITVPSVKEALVTHRLKENVQTLSQR